jgi:hypothetical protein
LPEDQAAFWVDDAHYRLVIETPELKSHAVALDVELFAFR